MIYQYGHYFFESKKQNTPENGIYFYPDLIKYLIYNLISTTAPILKLFLES